MSDYYARLKPFDLKREQAMRVFVLGSLRFEAGQWLPIDKATAGILRGVHQSYHDERSPLAFDVCTRQEAIALGLKLDTTAEASPNGATDNGAADAAPSGAPRTRKKDS